MLSHSVMSNSCDPRDCSPPGSSVHGILSSQQYWSGLPFPSPGDLPDPGTEPRSPALQSDSLLTKLQGKPPLRVLVRNKGNNPGQLGPTSSTREAYNPCWFLTLLLGLLLYLEWWQMGCETYLCGSPKRLPDDLSPSEHFSISLN